MSGILLGSGKRFAFYTLLFLARGDFGLIGSGLAICQAMTAMTATGFLVNLVAKARASHVHVVAPGASGSMDACETAQCAKSGAFDVCMRLAYS